MDAEYEFDLPSLLARLETIADPDARSMFYRDHAFEFLSSLVHLSDTTIRDEWMNKFTTLLPDDCIEQIRQMLEQPDSQGQVRYLRICRLQNETSKIIQQHLKGLPTQEDCWEYVLDHPKAIITPLAKLSILNMSSCQAIVEKLLVCIGRKKTELWRSINDEARQLRKDDFGRDLQLDKDGLQRSSNGSLQSNFLNTKKLLEEHLTSRVIGWDQFTNKIQWKRKPVWESDINEPATNDDAPGLGYRPMHESDITNATIWLNQQGLMKVHRETVKYVIRAMAFDYPFNSLYDYLVKYRGKWNGTDLLSAEYDLCGKLFKTPYRDEKEKVLCNIMLRKQLIGFMQRGLYPGCDFRTMLHLIGDQRARKTHWLKALAGPYYMSYERKKNDPSHSDNYTQMIGYWLAEIEESSRMRLWNYEVWKQFLSKTKNVVRKPYAEDHVELPQTCTMWGTSNPEMEFLPDPTGNSRHFVITVGWDFDKGETVPIEWFEQEIREQLLAQLIHLVEVDHEQNWLDVEQSLLHKEYVTKFEMKNDALYVVEQALQKASVQSGLGEKVWHYPGIHFDELFRYLQKTERNALPSKKAVKEGLLRFGLKSDAVINPLKLAKDKREYRWFLPGSDDASISKEDLEKMIQVRTAIYPVVEF